MNKHILQQRMASALLGLALMGSAGSALAVSDHVFATFDTDLTGAADGGGVAKTLSWSAYNASGGAPGSGSLYAAINWANAAGWQDSKINFALAWPGIETAPYVNIEFDVLVNTTNQPAAVNGTYGGIQVVVQGWSGWGSNGTNSYNWDSLGTVVLGATNTWQHYKISIANWGHNLANLVLNPFVNPGTNHVGLWIDNVMLTAPPQPPPVMSLKANTSPPGLQIIAGPSGDYNRQNIRTYPTNEMTWVGRPGTVTYSMTLGAFPAFPAYSGFQAHMMLVPNPAASTSPDWDYANALCLFVVNDPAANGQGVGALRFKTNSPAANAMYFQGPNDQGLPVGYPTNVHAASPVGTWSLSFSQDTNITITGPGGVIATATLTADQAALFASGVTFYVGDQPNGAAKNGQSITLTSVDITGTAAGPIHDTFTSFNAERWDNSTASSKAGFVIIGPNDRYVLSWTTPDKGFSELLTSSNLVNWVSSPLIEHTFLAGTDRKVVVQTADMPDANHGYFRLLKRMATRLQILLPGETSAPYTPSGKSGAPIPMDMMAMEAHNIVVNACDDNWVIVTSVTDQVQLSTSGGFPIWTDDPEGKINLVNGTGTAHAIWNDTGSFTITATDLSDPAKTPGTAAAQVVAP